MNANNKDIVFPALSDPAEKQPPENRRIRGSVLFCKPERSWQRETAGKRGRRHGARSSIPENHR